MSWRARLARLLVGDGFDGPSPITRAHSSGVLRASQFILIFSSSTWLLLLGFQVVAAVMPPYFLQPPDPEGWVYVELRFPGPLGDDSVDSGDDGGGAGEPLSPMSPGRRGSKKWATVASQIAAAKEARGKGGSSGAGKSDDDKPPRGYVPENCLLHLAPRRPPKATYSVKLAPSGQVVKDVGPGDLREVATEHAHAPSALS